MRKKLLVNKALHISFMFASELRLKLEYLNNVETQYGVRPQTLMGGARDLKAVNDWFKQKTGGKVDQILSSALPRNTAVLPVGAAYFKGKWASLFWDWKWLTFESFLVLTTATTLNMLFFISLQVNG